MSAEFDAFAQLQIPRAVVVDTAEVEAAYREAAKTRHPDAGGDAADFELLSRAKTTLLDDLLRVRHLLALAGAEEEVKGAVSKPIADLFGPVADVIGCAKSLAGQLENAGSSLQKALLQKPVMEAQGEISAMQMQLGEVNAEVLGGIASLDDIAVLQAASCDLAFISRWRGELQKAFASLWV